MWRRSRSRKTRWKESSTCLEPAGDIEALKREREVDVKAPEGAVRGGVCGFCGVCDSTRHSGARLLDAGREKSSSWNRPVKPNFCCERRRAILAGVSFALL
mmetsp:Transcript_69505/g.165745  ORF Transcript_69505/g.165745 Transcript_69505/m.165745 type:complete len:101 (+) Transcript_69505:425-727(+)|eukprot:CAMPEP_0181485288 /NCGR_PEP_ID=MMETSP1110-20121109/46486_1 /TAXON_ID=174948 /ORGANISM="Symbiodinium sp., Strain CCMP421" /LENGTH=100 /DNA_ID=CAMNT_0023611279 /DNA_START=360 /DNA_END=662 /DNA_ORIENTATION=-